MNEENKKEILDAQDKFVMKTYAPNLLLEKGEGCYLWDADGNKYLDLTAGIAVCNIGHCNAKVAKAIAKQANKLVHVSNLFINEQQPLLAKKLIEFAGFDGTAFFANSGAEANEGMIKLARKYGNKTDRNEIIVMEESFHGRTLAALAATGRQKYRDGFAPNTSGFTHVEYNNFEAIKNAITDKTAAILLEPIQGEGGIVPSSKDYLSKVRQLCDDKDILLMFDEVQCGIGRTGTFYGFQQFDIEPDIIALAKGLGNGFPIGAIVAKQKFSDVLTLGTHASTFGGTPLACAAANATLDVIKDENILENCCEVSKYTFEELNKLKKKYSFIKEVRGQGLMIGIDIGQPLGDLLAKLKAEKVLALPAGETVLRLLPPLTITKEEIKIGIDAIDKCFGMMIDA